MPQTSVMTSSDEPPSLLPGDQARRIDQVLAMAPTSSSGHVAVIGHHTLPFVLALMGHGCRCVRSLRPDMTAPDCEPADLAWIVDARDMHDLDEALRAARRRANASTRIVVEDVACRKGGTLSTLRRHALRAGLQIASVDPRGRLVLTARPCLAVAA